MEKYCHQSWSSCILDHFLENHHSVENMFQDVLKKNNFYHHGSALKAGAGVVFGFKVLHSPVKLCYRTSCVICQNKLQVKEGKDQPSMSLQPANIIMIYLLLSFSLFIIISFNHFFSDTFIDQNTQFFSVFLSIPVTRNSLIDGSLWIV